MNYIKKIISKLLRRKCNNKNNNAIIDNHVSYNSVSISNIQFKKSIKIPKIIHYVYVGDSIPYYINYSIKSCRMMNPDYDIKVHNYTISDFYNLDVFKNNNKNNCKLDDLIFNYKWHILNEYGGIILSNSTFILRNFDDILCHSKICYTYIDDNYNYCKDYCLTGNIAKCNINSDTLIYPPLNYNDKFYQTYKFLYMNGNLTHDKIFIHNRTLTPYLLNFYI
jgi:hypothetical protein